MVVSYLSASGLIRVVAFGEEYKNWGTTAQQKLKSKTTFFYSSDF
jgi:hypothetical protein